MCDLRQAKISSPLWTCDLVTHIHASYVVNQSGSGTVISYAINQFRSQLQAMLSTSLAHSYKLCNHPSPHPTPKKALATWAKYIFALCNNNFLEFDKLFDSQKISD